MPGMDTTPQIDRVRELLDRVAAEDPAAAIEPLSEIADILEALLDGDDV